MSDPIHLRAELAVGRHALDKGRVLEVAAWICDRPKRIPGLLELLWDDDPGIASRAADVLERISHQPSPALLRILQEYKEPLIGLLTEAKYKKLRWNLALTLPRLQLTLTECRRIAATLESWLDDNSSIVKTAALHGIAQLVPQNPGSLPHALDLLRILGRSGTPAMRARSRLLLQQMESPRSRQRPGRKLGSAYTSG